ncbi:flagellar hook assembly protein FlgD [Henriciella litoralis]|uniref:flagellar hook assembly protein FlgD n=1 Tax=Henriciella litoralis TaxID=568102 RepID=UPI000A03E105|nr:flagellar hook capping FlgD N-terminal domain-containing protein [Henriciella litoralis]
MSTVNPVSTNTAASSQSLASTAGTGEEFNNFLKLLTAQVRNQDPLSPLDSTQFVEQLATFSSLEQQVRSNSSLDNIAGLIGDLHAMFASEWLGESVTVESSWVPYSGNDIEFAVNAPDDADSALLNIKDSNGEVIWTEALNLSDDLYKWDGRTLSGIPATAESLFEFGIDLYSGTNYMGTAAPRIVTKVTDVASENGSLRVGTSSGLTADMGQVQKLDD